LLQSQLFSFGISGYLISIRPIQICFDVHAELLDLPGYSMLLPPPDASGMFVVWDAPLALSLVEDSKSISASDSAVICPVRRSRADDGLPCGCGVGRLWAIVEPVWVFRRLSAAADELFVLNRTRRDPRPSPRTSDEVLLSDLPRGLIGEMPVMLKLESLRAADAWS